VSTDDELNVVDRRSSPPEREQARASEFHRAVVQIVLQYVGAARDKRHLAVLAKAQAVASRAVRRLISRGELLNRQPIEFSPAEVLDLVREEDAADEREGTGR
jgi:hypothetical protein